jgi:hypothetical protein
MQAIEKLEVLLNRALQKVQNEQLRDICQALSLMLPETLAAIQTVAVAPESSPAQKLRASEMILGLHQRVLAASLEDDRTIALKEKARAISEAARAERSRVKLEGKKADLEIARTRRRNARLLDAAEKKLEKGKDL